MKYINQFLIILLISFLGEILNCLLPLPIPASKVIKLESVKETGKFLIEIMPIMFIPAGVGLMITWGVLQPILLPVSIITAVTIITVMVATGWVSQIIIRKSGKKKDE